MMMMNNKKKTKRKREREGEKIECHCGPIEKSSDQNGGRASLRLSLLNVARLFQPPTPLLPPCPSGRCRLDGGGERGTTNWCSDLCCCAQEEKEEEEGKEEESDPPLTAVFSPPHLIPIRLPPFKSTPESTSKSTRTMALGAEGGRNSSAFLA